MGHTDGACKDFEAMHHWGTDAQSLPSVLYNLPAVLTAVGNASMNVATPVCRRFKILN